MKLWQRRCDLLFSVAALVLAILAMGSVFNAAPWWLPYAMGVAWATMVGLFVASRWPTK